MTERRIKSLKRKLQESRFRIKNMRGDFAEPLYDYIYIATKDVRRISTNGRCIYFDPDWLAKLENVAIDFMLAHQMVHILSNHIERPQYFKGDRFHLACDIVVNSVLYAMGWQFEKLPSVGNIYTETFFPRISGINLSAQEAFNYVPFDPADLNSHKRRTYMIDSEQFWDKKSDRGQSGVIILTPKDEDPDDLICEPYILSPKKVSITKENFSKVTGSATTKSDKNDSVKAQSISKWNKSTSDITERLKDIKNSYEGNPEDYFTERIWQNSRNSKTNWKQLLTEFVQEEVWDYSFTPPDRRFCDSDFFMPDYNVSFEGTKRVLFMVDTSGSIDDKTLSEVYSEIYGALIQFGDALKGILCFFDTKIRKTVPFGSFDDIAGIIPVGDGGTDFDCIFDYLKTIPVHDLPADIVVFTDGYAKFPDEKKSRGIPLLWVINGSSVLPPWGKTIWIK